MSSSWSTPTQISQYAESEFENTHVSWIENENFFSLKYNDGKHTKTTRELLHLARDPKHDILDKTYYITATGFNFSDAPTIISGIEARLRMNRGGRITDDTIQLCLNNETIGNNKADLDLNPIKIYGRNDDMWGTGLSFADVRNSSFGITLRFKSHPKYPHKTSALIDTIELRIY